MAKNETKTPRDKMPRVVLMNAPLLGFDADATAARKMAATTSGKGYSRDRMISNSQPVDGAGDSKPAE